MEVGNVRLLLLLTMEALLCLKQDTLMAEIPCCTAPGSPWDQLHFWSYSRSFQNPSLVAQSTLQFCLTKCLLAEISRCGLELLPATHVPQRFAVQCWLTVRACSATLGPSKPPWVPQSTFSKLFQERQPLTDSLKPY